MAYRVVAAAGSVPAEFRRAWVRRIIDHDGVSPGGGGIENWLRLGESGFSTRWNSKCDVVERVSGRRGGRVPRMSPAVRDA